MIPKIKLPYYPVKIPDNNKTIHIKPYTIEIEKYLVQLDDKSNITTQLNVIRELLKYCIVEDNIDLDNLQIGTIIWLYLQCYNISVKDSIDFTYTHLCDKKNKCDIEIHIPIKDIKFDGDFNNIRIPIETEEGIYYVEFSALKLKGLQYIDAEDENSSLQLLCSCIVRMYDESGNNEIELTEEDKIEIVNSLPMKELNKITEKIQNIQKPYYVLEYDCPKCGKHIKEKIEDFFI